MQELGQGADFARHLAQKSPGFEERFFGGLVPGFDGLTNLSETEIDGENGLREAIVEFAADAAAFFVLELEELGGELMDGALRVLHFGKVSEREDDPAKRTAGVELGDGVEEGPEDVLEVRNAITNDLAIDRLSGDNDASERAGFFGDERSVFG